jgi:hypothetical protein
MDMKNEAAKLLNKKKAWILASSKILRIQIKWVLSKGDASFVIFPHFFEIVFGNT